MTKTYLKWLLVAVVIGLIASLSWLGESEPKNRNRGTAWLLDWEKEPVKSAMKERLDTAKLLTYVYGDSLMIARYPDFFEVQEGAQDEPDDSSVFFVHTTDSGNIYMRMMLLSNNFHWSAEQWADTLALYGQKAYGDTILMKDMHPDYFYLKIRHPQAGSGHTYQQYIVQKDTIYLLSVFYSSIFRDEDVQRLVQLVHDWNPK